MKKISRSFEKIWERHFWKLSVQSSEHDFQINIYLLSFSELFCISVLWYEILVQETHVLFFPTLRPDSDGSRRAAPRERASFWFGWCIHIRALSQLLQWPWGLRFRVCFCDLGYTGKATDKSDDLLVKYSSLSTIFLDTSSKGNIFLVFILKSPNYRNL